MNKTTPRGASAKDKKKKDVKKAQRRLLSASSNNNNIKESATPDSNDTQAPAAPLDNNNAGASAIPADDENSVFNSGSMATVSQMDNIEVNSSLNPISAGTVPQVPGEMLGGYELQPINPSGPLDDSTGEWIDWCDKDLALQSVPGDDEDDEETPAKVTRLVRLIVFEPGPTLFPCLSYFGSNFQLSPSFTFITRFFELTLTFGNNFFELSFYSPFWVRNYSS